MIARRALLRAGPALGLLAAGCAAGGDARLAGGQGPDEGGIGGTGIFGVVSARGSLVVNGLRVLTDAATRVETLAGAAGPAPGDAVAIHAVPLAGRFLAAQVAVFHPLVGPLSPGGPQGLAVLGTPVRVTEATVLRDPQGHALPRQALQDGARVAVSGLWRDEAVEASSLTLLPPGERVTLRGLLRREGELVLLGGTRIARVGMVAASALGRFVTVQGRAGADGLVPDLVTPEAVPLLAPPVGPLAVEGFVLPNRDAPGFHLGGFGLPLAPGAAPPVGRRALLLGRYRDAFLVEAAIPLPDRAEERAALLAAPATAEAIRRWRGG